METAFICFALTVGIFLFWSLRWTTFSFICAAVMSTYILPSNVGDLVACMIAIGGLVHYYGSSRRNLASPDA